LRLARRLAPLDADPEHSQGRITMDVKELQSTLMVAKVMQAKVEGYTSLEDIKTFAAIAEARLGYWLDRLEQIYQPKQPQRWVPRWSFQFRSEWRKRYIPRVWNERQLRICRSVNAMP
jgi:hypothetical protein